MGIIFFFVSSKHVLKNRENKLKLIIVELKKVQKMLKFRKQKTKTKLKMYICKNFNDFLFLPKNLSIISTDVSILLLENNLNVPKCTHVCLISDELINATRVVSDVVKKNKNKKVCILNVNLFRNLTKDKWYINYVF